MFAMKLNYKNAYSPQYNGNIASMQWNTLMFGTHTYQFVYDNANRLKFGYTTNFNTSYSYDNNGNLLTLSRQGRMGGSANYGMIDELTYDYSGNKLLAVNDVDEQNHQYNGFSDNYSFATNEFTYDANGNMLSDQNKDLDTIGYNFLNLPQQINFSEGYEEINYLYTANGQKLMKQVRTENAREQTVDYIGNFVYEGNHLRYILTEEGRVVAKSNGAFEYQYFLKDHLGNTRITFNQNSQIIQEDAYYPFGMQMNGLCYQSGVDYENKYLYNGKELQDEFGLDWYDYGARMYDAVIGRWHVVDPLAEDYYSWSPYIYSMNSPIILLDPNGEGVWDVIKGVGKGIANWATNTATGLSNIVSKTQEERTVDMIVFLAEVECVGVRQFAENVVDGVKQDVQDKVETIKNDENGEATAEIVTEVVLDVATVVVGTKGVGAVSKTKKGTEIVQRAMSKAELNATKSTGLLRGGRKGTHYASDAVNNTASKAQKRLALPNKPEVKVTLEVPSGNFSTPSKVEPAFNQPGGGMQRTATGNVPVVVRKVKEYIK